MTATEGLAFAGLVLSLFLGYLSYRTGREARDDARAIAKEARESAAEEARLVRLFERRKDVYEEVLEYVYRSEDMVNRTEPVLTSEGAPGPPDWPTEEEIRRQNARTAAWGTKELLDNLIELKKAVQKFQGAVFVARTNREHMMETAEDLQKIEDTRQAVKALVRGIIALVSAELAR